MQSHTQEQPLALTTAKTHYPTNGKEEEMNTGETQNLSHGGFMMQPSTDHLIGWLTRIKNTHEESL